MSAFLASHVHSQSGGILKHRCRVTSKVAQRTRTTTTVATARSYNAGARNTVQRRSRSRLLLHRASSVTFNCTCLIASSLPAMLSLETLALIALASLALLAVLFLIRLAVADADVALLLRGPHKADAFEGKVIWITGASQGLGERLAKYFAARGAKLILSSRRREALEAVKAQCNVPAAQVEVLPFDLCGTYEELANAAAAADGLFDGAGVDYIVQNAGASQHALAEATTAPVTRSLFDLNALGPILLTRAVLPFMLKRKKGHIVVVASMAAKVPSPGQAVYSAAKMALYGYFSTVATEVADKGVRVTICCPGPISTGDSPQPRVVYGPTGKVTRQPETAASSKSRVAPDRCVELIANAMAHQVDECWIAKHPVLLMAYITQYLPWLGWLVLKKIGPKRAKAVQDGEGGYDASKLLFKKST